MKRRRIGAVTFDLWDCLFRDDTDEPKRKAAGLPPKPVARRDAFFNAVGKHAPMDRAVSDAAYNVMEAAFSKVWHDEHVTWRVVERLNVLLKGLNLTLPQDELDALVKVYETMELDYRPDPAPGAVEALGALHGKYPLAVVSDTVYTPGWGLRELLRGAGMFPYFDCFVFSDENGHSKPHPSVFEAVAKHFNIAISDIVHVGDRPHNDIGGPHAVGARGVLLTVVKQRPLDGHTPDAVCDEYAKLPAILAALEV
ncbi:MAG TPA: HAD family hydrolase [Candidatus Hydrogenedentes bacterium]|nr:HAD family hydrolase [Candidatus Hydrogenedentota bacterium]HNT88851.1 HAD family hydrolase [Candidatus Hydrogenedentota bacterium]